MEISDVVKALKDYQLIADELNVKVDVIGMYQAFYEQHRMVYGSAVGKSDYDLAMDERYLWCFKQVADVIDCKAKYKEV